MAESDLALTDSVEALAQTVAKLRSERDGLRVAMRNRAVIEQAKGMLAERLSVDPEQAFRHLIEMSTHHNVKVAELAAAVVSGTQPEPPEPAETAVPVAPAVPEEMDAPESDSLAFDPHDLAAELRLIGTRVEAATTFDELAEAMAVPTTAWPAPANVIVLLLEGDGALRLVGSAGLSPTTRSQWDRVPPIETVPIVAAVRNRSPVYLADLEAVSRQFPIVADRPHEALVAMPLVDGDNVIGVVELTWATAPLLDKHARSHLLRLAEPATRRCRELSDRPEAFTGTSITEDSLDSSLATLFLEALNLPAVLLAPRYGDNGQLVDFDTEFSNTAAAPIATKPNGRPQSLLTALPESGARRLLPAFASTLRGGRPCMLRDIKVSMTTGNHSTVYTVDIRASRIWEKLLVTWRVESGPTRHYESFLRSERAFGTGAFFWELETGEIRMTPGLYHLIGLDPEKGTPGADKLVSLIQPEDQEEIVKTAMETLQAGGELRVELRGGGTLAGRVFELVAEGELAPGGEVRVVRGACRDITAERRHGDQRRRDRISSAAQRAERDTLRSTLDELLAPSTVRHAVDVEINGHTVSPTGTDSRSWYDAVDRGESTVALIVGEVNGDDPTAAMLRLRLSVLGFAASGMNPAEAMAAANAAFAATVPGRTATLTLARLDLRTGVVAWSAAGQAGPVLTRRGTPLGHLTSGSLGLPIGADSAIEYQLNHTELKPGDQLLLYTDGLIVTAGAGTPRLFEALRKGAAATTAELAFDTIRDGEPATADSAASLMLVRRTT